MQCVVKDGADGAEPRSVAGVNWRFNAWGGAEGGLYSSWERDQGVASAILQVGQYRQGRAWVFGVLSLFLCPRRGPEHSWPPPATSAARPRFCFLPQMAGLRRFACPIVMEGGSIHVDGEGTLLTTGEGLVGSAGGEVLVGATCLHHAVPLVPFACGPTVSTCLLPGRPLPCLPPLLFLQRSAC